jgi:hypothetical protein
MFASKGLMIPPCGVPIVTSRTVPSSITPARSHFISSRTMRGSAIRCSMNLFIHPWSMVSKNDRMSASSTQLTFLPIATASASSASC